MRDGPAGATASPQTPGGRGRSTAPSPASSRGALGYLVQSSPLTLTRKASLMMRPAKKRSPPTMLA